MENKITLKLENGKKQVYDILFEVESNEYNYLIYSNKKRNVNNDLVAYFGKYVPGELMFMNVTKKEEEKLKLILNKFRGRNEN